MATPGDGIRWEGLTFGATWYQDLLRNASGGIEQGWGRSRMLELTLTADLERAADMPGATAHIGWYAVGGGLLSSKTGDLQIVSNIEGPRRSILSELWFEQRLADDTWRLKLGKLDANSEFAFVEHGLEFVNSSFGFSPSIFVFPSYPDPAYAAMADWRPVENLSVKAGVFDGSTQAGEDTGSHGVSSFWSAPVERFAVGQVELSWGEDRGGRAAVGAWRHGGSFDRFDGGTDSHADGTYMMLEQVLWTAPAAHDAPPRGGARAGANAAGASNGDGSGSQAEPQVVAAFAQLARADDALTEFGGHLGAGVTWSGFLPRQMLGLAVTRVELSEEPGAGLTEDHETAIEAFWRWQATDRLVLKPDVQYVIHPGGAGLDDALVAGLRLEWRL